MNVEDHLHLQRRREHGDGLLGKLAELSRPLLVQVLTQPARHRGRQAVRPDKDVESVDQLAVLREARIGVGRHVAEEREDVCPQDSAKEHHHADDDRLVVGLAAWVVVRAAGAGDEHQSPREARQVP